MKYKKMFCSLIMFICLINMVNAEFYGRETFDVDEGILTVPGTTTLVVQDGFINVTATADGDGFYLTDQSCNPDADTCCVDYIDIAVGVGRRTQPGLGRGTSINYPRSYHYYHNDGMYYDGNAVVVLNLPTYEKHNISICAASGGSTAWIDGAIVDTDAVDYDTTGGNMTVHLNLYSLSSSSASVGEVRWSINANWTAPVEETNIELLTPSDNLVFNGLVNFTFNSTYNWANCSLWHNVSGTWKQNQTVLGVNRTENVTFWSGNTFDDGKYIYNVFCNGTNLSAPTNYTFTIDDISPLITLTNVNTFNDLNTSFINPFDTNISLSVNFWDNNALFQSHINITNSTGKTKFFNNSLLNGTDYNFTNIVNVSDWSLGVYSMYVEVSDSHTKKAIKDYIIKKEFKSLRFETEAKNDIYIKSDDENVVSTTTTKNIDRYEWGFTYSDAQMVRHYDVTSNNPITYIKDSGYRGHFVIWNDETHLGNWIDFEENNIDRVTVHKINNYHYKVTTIFKDDKSFNNFKSIGGLNKNNQTFLFNITGIIDFNVSDNIYDEAVNFTVTVDNQIATSQDGSVARLYNLSKGNHTFSFKSADAVDQDFVIEVNESYQAVKKEVVKSRYVIVNVFDEITGLRLDNESVTLNVKGNITSEFNFNYTPYNISSLPIGEYYFQLESDTRSRRSYYVDVNNNSQYTLNAYLLLDSESGAQSVTYVFKTNDLERISDAIITYQRLINGTYTTIHQEETDYAGQTQLTQDSFEEYKIIFEKVGLSYEEIFIRPIDTYYDISISVELDSLQTQQYGGIVYKTYPSAQLFNVSDEFINFTINLTSADGRLDYYGVKILYHDFECQPSNCSSVVNSAYGGVAGVKIKLNNTGRFALKYFFKPNGLPEQEINLNWKGADYLFHVKNDFFDWVKEFKGETSDISIVASATFFTIAMVGFGSQIGIIGVGLVMIVVIVQIMLSILEFINPLITLLNVIFGVGIYYMLSKTSGGGA